MKSCFFWMLLFFLAPVLTAQNMVVIDESFDIARGEFELKLDVDGGEVSLIRGEGKRECRVYVKYNEEKCSADVRFDKKHNRMKVKVDIEDWPFSGDDSEKGLNTEVQIELPYKVEINLDAKVKAGTVDFQLGDLELKNFDLRVWAGEVKVEFDRPNRTVLETFDVNAKVGETSLLQLGNANFKEADINAGIGEMTVDFTGSKLERATARIDLDIGETTLILPQHVGIKMKVSKFSFLSEVDYPGWFRKKGRYYYSDNYDDSDRSLYLMISQGIGELRIEVE